MLYAIYFLVGAVSAPLLAYNHHLEAADYFYSVLSAACQQQPSRTFWIAGYPMAICSRCFGVYFGFVLMTFWWAKGNLKPNKSLFFCLLSFGIGEKFAEWFIWEANNGIRFASGIFLGCSILIGVVLIIQFIWRLLSKHDSQKIAVSDN